MKKDSSFFLAPTTLFAAVLSVSGGAFAQESEVGVIEEVIVTATKREADVFDIPIATSTFTGSEIEDSGVVHLVDLPLVEPSFSVAAPAGWLSPFIRGVGTNTAGLGTYASVAMYVDGVYQANSLSINASTLDSAESVQVLNGPQGTLYGRNATGGAILVNTYTPKVGDEFGGQAQIDIGDYDARRFTGRVSGGFGESFASSVDVTVRQRDGFVENRGVGGDFADEDGWNVAAKLVFEPSDRLSFVLSGKYNEDESNVFAAEEVGQFDSDASPFPGLNNPQALWAGTVLQFIQGGVLQGGGTPADAAAAVAAQLPSVLGFASQIEFLDDIHETAGNSRLNGYSNGILDNLPGDLGWYSETSSISLNATYSTDTFDVVSITSFSQMETGASTDVLRADPATLPDLTTIGLPALFNQGNLGFSADLETDTFTQEVYAVSTDSDIEWIVGAYYFKDSGESHATGDVFGTSTPITNNEHEIESISAYVELTYPISEALGLTAGVRYTEEDIEVDDFLFGNPAIPNVGNPSISDDQTTYNLKLTYNLDDLLVYGGVSTGFKSGSLNTANPGAGQVGAEEVTSYEVGFKSKLADGRVSLTGAAFVYDFENIQLNVLSVGTGVVFLVDGVEADIEGIELGVDVLLSESVNVFANATWLDNEYLNDALVVATGETLAIEGNQLTQAAEFVATLGLNYNYDFSSGASVGARILGNYNSGFWADQTNTFGSGGDDDDSFFVANASVSYTSASGHWTLTGYVNNLTDEEYYTAGQSIAGNLAQIAAAGNPRHFGARLRYDF